MTLNYDRAMKLRAKDEVLGRASAKFDTAEEYESNGGNLQRRFDIATGELTLGKEGQQPFTMHWGEVFILAQYLPFLVEKFKDDLKAMPRAPVTTFTAEELNAQSIEAWAIMDAAESRYFREGGRLDQ